MVAEDHAAGALQVARYNVGLARNVLAEEIRDQPHLAVDPASGRHSGEQRDRLAAVEILRLRGVPAGDASNHQKGGDPQDARGEMTMHRPAIPAVFWPVSGANIQ